MVFMQPVTCPGCANRCSAVRMPDKVSSSTHACAASVITPWQARWWAAAHATADTVAQGHKPAQSEIVAHGLESAAGLPLDEIRRQSTGMGRRPSEAQPVVSDDPPPAEAIGMTGAWRFRATEIVGSKPLF